MKKPGKDSLINKALAYLEETSENLFDLSIDIVFHPRKILSGTSIYRDYNLYPNLYNQKIHNLKSSSYFTEKNDRIYLTTKGRITIIKSIIKKKNRLKEWNGKWIAVIFDIPEKNRKERVFLRKELKWIGFKELQKSIWIFPFDIHKELVALLKLWKVDFSGDIRILIIDAITEDARFKKLFHLP